MFCKFVVVIYHFVVLNLVFYENLKLFVAFVIGTVKQWLIFLIWIWRSFRKNWKSLSEIWFNLVVMIFVNTFCILTFGETYWILPIRLIISFFKLFFSSNFDWFVASLTINNLRVVELLANNKLLKNLFRVFIISFKMRNLRFSNIEFWQSINSILTLKRLIIRICFSSKINCQICIFHEFIFINSLLPFHYFFILSSLIIYW